MTIARMPATTPLTLGLLIGALSAPGLAFSGQGEPLKVPSGQQVFWQDMVTAAPGGNGLSYRFRFVAPDLANLVPMTDPEPMEAVTDEDMAAFDALAAAGNSASIVIANPDAGSDGTPVIEIVDVPGDTAPATGPTGEFVLPPAPEALLRDPMHDDIVWLCENFALPRIASPAPRPTEIVISLSDRPVDGAGLEPGVVQLIEAFSLPPDSDTCIWEPY